MALSKKKKLPPLGKLQKQCDKKMQEVGKLLYPKSIISGLPTEVMHHLIEKSVSSRMRYDWENLIPLTNAEHCRLHQSGDLDIVTKIIKAKGGLEWFEKLRKRGREIIKINREYYEQQMENLKTWTYD